MAKTKAAPSERKKSAAKIKSVVGPIVLLTLVFFLGQYAYQIYVHTKILENGEVYHFFSDEIIRSGIIDLSILYFLLVQILLISLYIVAVWLLTRLVGITFKWTKNQMRSWGIFIWIITTLAVCLTHEYLYPYSNFSVGVSFLKSQGIVLTPEQIKYAVLAAAGACALIGLLALFGLMVWFTKNLIKSIILLLILTGCGYLYYQNTYLSKTMQTKTQSKLPNIVLINLDGLQANQLRIFDSNKKSSPYINNFLSQSTVFAQNVSPSLQEFPVWLSLFTGKYPNENGMTQNYMPVPTSIVDTNLVRILKNKGYTTAYVADNSRTTKMQFLNSFDYISAPPADFSNLLLGEINDFIVSNLLTNTIVGPYLFPFSYGSREITESYEPQSLINRVSRSLEKKSDNGVFLVINTSLAKWPYGWRNSPSASYESPNDAASTKNYSYYQKAVNALDQQFNSIIGLLKEKGVLKNSVVILFSAKGEYFNDQESNLITLQNYAGTQDVSQLVKLINGKQYVTKAFHTPVAIRLFGNTGTNQTKPVNTVTSTIDIFATIMDFIGTSSTPSQSYSMLPAVRGEAAGPNSRTVYFEGGKKFDRLTIDNPNLSRYLTKGLKLFNINCCTGAIQLTPDAIASANSKQSYGKVTYPNIIVKLPQEAGPESQIIYNLLEKKWTINSQLEQTLNQN